MTAEATTKSILVVDDEDTIREVIRRYLERDGFVVREAADGYAALEAIQDGPPDLIVLDLMLPGVDGLSITQQLRERHRIPIIMLTAKGETSDRIRGLDLGADDYMAKPFSPQELVSRVKAVLRRSSEAAPLPGLPGQVLELIAKRTGISLTRMYGVATFYERFRFKPVGRHLVHACHGTACHVGGERMREICAEMGWKNLQPLADEIVSRSEVVAREEIRKLPKGTYRHEAKIDIVHVAYKGAAPALQDVIAGHVQMMFATAASVVGLIRDHKVRPLAVTTPKRTALLPDIPTVAELGIPGFDATTWHGLVAPAGTSNSVNWLRRPMRVDIWKRSDRFAPNS